MALLKRELGRLWWSFRRLGIRQDVYIMLGNLTSLLSSGISVLEAISVLQEDTASRRMRKVLKTTYARLEQGSSLSDALEESHILSPRIYTLLEIGEQSGNLVANLELANLQNEKESMFRSKVRSSLLYAVTVGIVAIAVMLATSLFALPRLADFYEEIDAELPLITVVLINIGHFLAAYGHVFLPLAILNVLVLLYFLFSFPKTRFIGHTILFRLPLIKRLLIQSEVSRFGFLLGTELRAGIPIVRALGDMPSTTTFKNYKKLYVHLQHEINRGQTLRQSFDSYKNVRKLIPAQAISIISSGERSGTLADALLRVGTIYEQKILVTTKNIPTILEPLIIVVLGLFVAAVAFATTLPIYSLVDTF